jgi:hypothetical protein
VIHAVAHTLASFAHPAVYRQGASFLLDAYNVWFLLKLRRGAVFTL